MEVAVESSQTLATKGQRIVGPLKRTLLAAVGESCDLDREQESDMELLLGEAITNAIKHRTQGKISLGVEYLPDGVMLEIANQSLGFPDIKPVLPEEGLSEHGYGCNVIDTISESLRKGGLEIECSYRFEPQGSPTCGWTIFQLTIVAG